MTALRGLSKDFRGNIGEALVNLLGRGKVTSVSFSFSRRVDARGLAADESSKKPVVENSAQFVPTVGDVEDAVGSVAGLACRVVGEELLAVAAAATALSLSLIEKERLREAPRGFCGRKRLKVGDVGADPSLSIGMRDKKRMVSSAKM